MMIIMIMEMNNLKQMIKIKNSQIQHYNKFNKIRIKINMRKIKFLMILLLKIWKINFFRVLEQL